VHTYPLLKSLIKFFLSEEGIKAITSKTENTYMADNNHGNAKLMKRCILY
jgi:hypothetical protein